MYSHRFGVSSMHMHMSSTQLTNVLHTTGLETVNLPYYNLSTHTFDFNTSNEVIKYTASVHSSATNLRKQPDPAATRL